MLISRLEGGMIVAAIGVRTQKLSRNAQFGRWERQTTVLTSQNFETSMNAHFKAGGG